MDDLGVVGRLHVGPALQLNSVGRLHVGPA